MFGGPHQRDEGKRIEQSGGNTKNRTTTSAKSSPHKLLPRSCTGVYTRIKNLTESLLTRPTSLDMSPVSPSFPQFPQFPTPSGIGSGGRRGNSGRIAASGPRD